MDRPEFLTLCEQWLANPNTEAFAVVVREGSAFMKCERTLAGNMEIAVSTVERWGKGSACPHPLLQAQVVRRLEALARTPPCAVCLRPVCGCIPL